MFLDPTASHLIICTTTAENYYLHQQSRHPRPLARLRGVTIEAIAWNPALPTASTREILIGASDGNIYEAFIDSGVGGTGDSSYYVGGKKAGEKYVRSLHKVPDGPVTGLWADVLPSPSSGGTPLRRVLVATQTRLLHIAGRAGGSGANGGDGSVYARLFDGEQPTVHELPKSTSSATATMSTLVVSPDPDTDESASASDSARKGDEAAERSFAWLSSHGVFHGRLLTRVPQGVELGERLFAEAKMFPRSQLAAASSADGKASSSRKKTSASPEQQSPAIQAIALTQWHILHLVGPRVVATNRLTGQVVYDQVILLEGQRAIGLVVDAQKNTFWLFTSQEIFEIVVRDEDRDVWRIMLAQQQFESAMRYARTAAQRDAVATATGDHLMKKGSFVEAATVYGRSSKPFEEVALAFMDGGQPDALRKYLLAKLATYKKSQAMQRVMIAAWLVEVFMARLNSLEDAIATKAELVPARAENLSTAQSRELLSLVRAEYQAFVTRHKADLDRRTVYDVISSHGREEELLFFATAVGDHDYVLAYWVRRERWRDALTVLSRQQDPQAFYRYATVLMTSHVAAEFVDVLMRHPELEPRELIPALLAYDESTGNRVPLAQHQAIRYLQYVVGTLGSTDPAVHNTLVSMYAAHSGSAGDESALLAYLESQGDKPHFDQDFALRLCIRHRRVLACVHMYTSMGQYLQAVELALSHDEVELASLVADRPQNDPALRKRLWLAVARHVISRHGNNGGIRAAIDLLRRSSGGGGAGGAGGGENLLRIEDLIPFFPDFVVIDDFKDEICAALEDYGRGIDALRREMDESERTAANIRLDVAALDRRYAIVEPGERCHACGLPLLSRQFFVFPCQHAFHSDCLGRRVMEQAGPAHARRIRDLQAQISQGSVAAGPGKDAMVAELDSLVASAW